MFPLTELTEYAEGFVLAADEKWFMSFYFFDRINRIFWIIFPWITFQMKVIQLNPPMAEFYFFIFATINNSLNSRPFSMRFFK